MKNINHTDNQENQEPISRRHFFKILGGVAATTVAVSCSRPASKDAEGSAKGDIPQGRMTYRINAHGDKVSLLGYGCMRLPLMEEGNTEAEIDMEMVKREIDYAFAHGLNLIDTAPPYCKGRSEHVMGEVLSAYDRSSYFLSTKLSNFDPSTWSREASIEIYRHSLQELRTDHLDYLLLHCVGMPAKDLEGNELDGMQAFQKRFIENGMLDFLMEERAAGRIRNLGFSHHGDVRVFDHLLSQHDKYHWDVVLIQHNYVDWHHAKEINERNTNSEYLYGELEKRDIPVFVMEPLLGGRLADVGESAFRQMKQRDPQASAASWTFRFAGSKPRILSVLSGMTYMEHLQDNLRTFCPFRPLNEEEASMLSDIADVYVHFPIVPCTHCEYCMPCPYGLDIPGVFAHYNKCLNEGRVVENPQSPEYKEARRAFLVGYDRAVSPLRQANHCIACGRCLSSCPQSIDIPKEMQRIDSFVENLKQHV